MGKKLLFIFLGALLLIGLLSGCAKKDGGSSEVTSPLAGQVTRPESYQNIYGVYTGQIDNNFIEIRVDQGQSFPGGDEAAAFLLPGDKGKDVANLKTNDRVKFSCFKNSADQWEITLIGKENAGSGLSSGSPGGGALKDEDFAVEYNQQSIKLGDWDKDVDIPGIFGRLLLEKVEQLGAGADTFAGSYVKRMVYDGLELGLMSPRDNGKTFFIDTIHITGSQYATARGVMVGDSYTEVLKAYPDRSGEQPAKEDPRNRVYCYFSDNAGSMHCLGFEVRDGSVKSITLQIEHP